MRRTGKGPRWPDIPWDPNTFGRYNGDGYLLYPGPDGVPYPSIRLKALRDGFENYEYLWLLRQRMKQAKAAGKLCARLVCRKRGRGGVCTGEIRAKPGERLRFRGCFKAVGAHGPCFVNFEGDPGDGWARIELPRRIDYDWTEVTGVVTVKPPRRGKTLDADGNVRILVFIYTKAFGELWIDDVSLTPVAQ